MLYSSIMSPGAAVGFDITSLMTTEPGRGALTGSAMPGVPPGVPLASQPALESQSEAASVTLCGTKRRSLPRRSADTRSFGR